MHKILSSGLRDSNDRFTIIEVAIVLQSCILVFFSEMGDKTQLLALILALRFKKPGPIMAGIFVATILNHALASWLGVWAASFLAPQTLKWIIAGVFIAFAVWILIPDKDEGLEEVSSRGAFLTTVIAFFFAEMGDKTQLATVALGAQFNNMLAVTAGTTLGMLMADGLAVFFGEKLTKKIPLQWVRRITSMMFALFGVAVLLF